MNLDQLKKDIQEFEDFKNAIDRQQLTFPLDTKSLDVVQKDLIVPTGEVLLAAQDPDGFTADSQEVDINGKKYFLQLSS